MASSSVRCRWLVCPPWWPPYYGVGTLHRDSDHRHTPHPVLRWDDHTEKLL